MSLSIKFREQNVQMEGTKCVLGVQLVGQLQDNTLLQVDILQLIHRNGPSLENVDEPDEQEEETKETKGKAGYEKIFIVHLGEILAPGSPGPSVFFFKTKTFY